MNPLKAIYVFLLPVMMVLSASSVMAESHDSSDIASFYNSNRELSSFEAPLKTQFKTQEDHRQIDKTLTELEGKVDKWLWRFEVPQKNKLAFRVNGRIQWVMETVDAKNKIFKLNGKNLQIKPGESYLSFQTKVTTLLDSKVAFYDQFFFHEAHAGFPLFLLGAIAVGGSMAAAPGQAPPRCTAISNPIANFTGKNRKSRTGHFRNGVSCSNSRKLKTKWNSMGGMPADYQKRIEKVSGYYRGAFSDMIGGNGTLKAKQSCISYYAPNTGAAVATQVCKCIELLQRPCGHDESIGGWNMIPPNPPYNFRRDNPAMSYQQSMAAQTCMVAYAHSQNQCAAAPYVAPRRDNPVSGGGGGVYDDIPQIGKGGSQQPSNPYDDVPTIGKGGQNPPYQQPNTRD